MRLSGAGRERRPLAICAWGAGRRSGEGRQIPGRAVQPERRGETPLPDGPAIKGRNTPARLPSRFPAPGKCTSHLGFGLGSTLGGQSNMGGHSESYARSYASDPESRDGTLQVSRAGNAGKSLTTPISIRSRQSLRQGVFGEIWHRQPNHLPVSSPDEATKKPQWCGNGASPKSTPAPAPATAATAQG